MTGTPGGIPAADWQKAQHYGALYHVDPYLLVAIGMHETQWGRLGDGRRGNILGVGSFDSGSSYQWAGVDNQLNKGAQLLSSWGVHTIADVQAGKASRWATDPQWEAGVARSYAQVSGTTLPPVTATTAPSVATAGLSLNPLKPLMDLVSFITNKRNWVRLGLFIAGGIVMLLALSQTKAGASVKSAAGKAAVVAAL